MEASGALILENFPHGVRVNGGGRLVLQAVVPPLSGMSSPTAGRPTLNCPG